MKKFLLLVAAVTLSIILTIPVKTDKSNDIPSANVKNLMGQEIDTKTFDNDGKPFVINFWATWCKSCILELSTIHDLYPDWQDETGVKIIAISIDEPQQPQGRSLRKGQRLGIRSLSRPKQRFQARNGYQQSAAYFSL